MFLKKFLSSIFCSIFILQSLSPCYAVGFDSVDSLLESRDLVSTYPGQIKTSLNFKPSAQTAAGLFNWAIHQGEAWVLLGQRDDIDAWCTPGGKSKPGEASLANTAATEGAEESFNIYAPHPSILKRQAFVDLATLDDRNSEGTSSSFASDDDNESSSESISSQTSHGSVLSVSEYFRLYFNKVQYLDAKIFKKRLADAVDSSSKEYKDFRWVRLMDVLYSLEDQSPIIQFSEKVTINLYEPLFDILSTPTARNFLTSIVEQGHIARALPRNLLYVLDQETDLESLENAELKSHWHIPTFDAQALHDAQNYKKAPFKGPLEAVPFDQDAFGRPAATRATFLLMPNDSETLAKEMVTYNAEQARQTFGHAVALKAALNAEIKEIFAEPTPPPSQEAQDLWAPTRTLSDLLLEFQLGKEYTPSTNSASKDENRKADLKNIKLYLEKSIISEGELKRKAEINPSDVERIADVYALERENKDGWIPMIHATQADISFFARLATELRRLLSLGNFMPGTTPGLRGTDIYFDGHDTMDQSIASTTLSDYDYNNQSRRLSTNMAISPGLNSTLTTSSSLEYFINAHSVQNPNVMKRFEECMHLLGLSDCSFAPFQGLFEQYFANLHQALPQSTLLLLLVNPKIAAKYSVAKYVRRPSNEPQFGSTMTAFQKAQTELETTIGTPAVVDAKTDTSSAKEITELRFLLHPEIMYDPQAVRVHATDRFPLDDDSMRELSKKTRQAIAYDLGTWLAQHTKVMPHAFHGPLMLKKLYEIIHRNLTGLPVMEESTTKGFVALVGNGSLESVKSMTIAGADSLNLSTEDKRKLVKAALHSDKPEMFNYIVFDLLKSAPEHFISLKEVQCFAMDGDDASFINLVSKYPKSFISSAVTTFWAKGFCGAFVDRHDYDGAPLEKWQTNIRNFNAHVHPIDMPLIKKTLKQNLNRLGSKNLLDWPTSTPTEMAMLMCEVTLENRYPIPYISGLVDAFKDPRVDHFSVLPSTGCPLFFHIVELERITNLDLSFESERYLTATNTEGLNFFQYAQKCFLEGKYRGNMSDKLKPIWNRFFQRGSFTQISYPAFIEEFGKYFTPESYPLNDLFTSHFKGEHPRVKTWVQNFKKAITSDSLKEIQQVWNGCPDSCSARTYAGLVHTSPGYSYAIDSELEALIQGDSFSRTMDYMDKKYPTNNHYMINNFFNVNRFSSSDFHSAPDLDTPQKLKYGRLAINSQYALYRYFSPDYFEVMQQTVRDLYPTIQTIIDHCLYLDYSLDSLLYLNEHLLPFFLETYGVQPVAESLPLSQWEAVFDNVSSQTFETIEQKFPDFITCRTTQGDMITALIETEHGQDKKFLKKYLRTIQNAQTYGQPHGGMILFGILADAPYFLEYILQVDPQILGVKNEIGMTLLDATENLDKWVGESLKQKIRQAFKTYNIQ